MNAGDRHIDEEQSQQLLKAELRQVRATIAGTVLLATPDLENYRPVVKTLVFHRRR